MQRTSAVRPAGPPSCWVLAVVPCEAGLHPRARSAPPAPPAGMLIALIAHGAATSASSECAWYMVAFTFGGCCLGGLACRRRPCSHGRQWRLCLAAAHATPPARPADTTLGLLFTIGLHKAALRGARWYSERQALRSGATMQPTGPEGTAAPQGSGWADVLQACGNYGAGGAPLGGCCVRPRACCATSQSSTAATPAALPCPPPPQASRPRTAAGASSWASGWRAWCWRACCAAPWCCSSARC